MSETEALYRKLALNISRKADRIFKYLLLFQWALAVGLALLFSPFAWEGTRSSLHLHVQIALWLGGVLALGPILLLHVQPDDPMNRNIIAVAQALFSTLLIHVSGGRIETHFHIFGSLAFLSFYRSRGPIWVATVVFFVDHLMRGHYWPESIYGVAVASPWRAVEHVGWVLFESIVLLQKTRIAQEEMRSFAETQVRLEVAVSVSAKMSGLGEFISGVAHEIINPLSAISGAIDLYEMRDQGHILSADDLRRGLGGIKRNVERIAKIVKALKNYARTSQLDPMEIAPISRLAEEVAEICQDSLTSASIKFQMRLAPGLDLECRPSEIEQVLINLIGNAKDAILPRPKEERWIRLEAWREGNALLISVTDSGNGIDPKNLAHLMTPFFTTKPRGHGTGLGLSISRKLLEAHQGSLTYDKQSPNTRFIVRLPVRQPLAGSGGASPSTRAAA